MKFQANRDVFSEAVSFAVKLLPQRTTLPILSGVLIEASGDGLTLSSFDYEVSSQTQITADVEEPGRVLVSGRLLSDIANRLPNAPVRFYTEDTHIIVTAGSAKFTLLNMPVEEYPSLPLVSDQNRVCSRPKSSRRPSPRSPSPPPATMSLTFITGVQLEISDNSLSLVATDRYRVAVRNIDWDSGTSEHRRRPPRSGAGQARCRRSVKTFGNSRNHLGRHHEHRRPGAHRLQGRSQDRDIPADQGQLSPGQASLSRVGRQLRRDQHRRSHRGDQACLASCSNARRPCGSLSRSTG